MFRLISPPPRFIIYFRMFCVFIRNGLFAVTTIDHSHQCIPSTETAIHWSVLAPLPLTGNVEGAATVTARSPAGGGATPRQSASAPVGQARSRCLLDSLLVI